MRPVILLMTEGARAFARRKLGDAIGAQGAAEAMVANTLRVAACAGDIVVCAPATSTIAIQFAREGKPFLRQTSGSRGARVAAAFEGLCALAAGRPVMMIGDDCPGMTEEHLAEAVEKLEAGAETVVGRLRDGGFWLLGLARWDAALGAALAASVEWSTPRAFASLRTFLVASFAGPMGILPELSDLDAPGDLAEALRVAESAELKAALGAVRPGRAILRADDETTLAPRGEHGIKALFRAPRG